MMLRHPTRLSDLKPFLTYREDALARGLYGVACQYDLVQLVDQDLRQDFQKARMVKLGNPWSENFAIADLNIVRFLAQPRGPREEAGELSKRIQNLFALAPKK